MKIAIVSDDQKTIASHFGRARGFVIFEVDGKEIKNREYRLNTFTGHARGLENAGIEVFITNLTDIQQALNTYLKALWSTVQI